MQNVEQIYRQNNWWSRINWTAMERTVRIFQERIFRASKKGNKKEVKNLMRLLVKSDYAKLLAIYL